MNTQAGQNQAALKATLHRTVERSMMND
jgi:hypothetical protein